MEAANKMQKDVKSKSSKSSFAEQNPWVNELRKKHSQQQSEYLHQEIDELKQKNESTKSLDEKKSEPSLFSMENIKKKIETHITNRQKKQNKSSEQGSGSIIHDENRDYLLTGIPGFDDLLEKGIPKDISLLIAGGAGSGKTIFCLQMLTYAALQGEKCLYLSFEESEEKLKQHMEDFGWNWKQLEDNKNLKIVRKDPFILTASVEAMLAKAKGELLIDINEVIDIIPQGFTPDRIVIDSITSIAAAFPKRGEGYRVFIEQLFRYLETLKTTSFLISETEQVPKKFSSEGIEEFLADGVIVLYAIKQDNVRENAIEVLKMRGAKHQKNIVAMSIGDKGITVFPEQEMFMEIGE